MKEATYVINPCVSCGREAELLEEATNSFWCDRCWSREGDDGSIIRVGDVPIGYYQCQECDFQTPVNEAGGALMRQHLKSEHDIAFAGEFKKCNECGTPVLCGLGSPPPATCKEHQ